MEDYHGRISLITDKIRRCAVAFGGHVIGLPYNNGCYTVYDDERTRFGNFGGIDWTDGFWAGVFSLAYMHTHEECFLKCIEDYRGLAERAARRTAEESARQGWLDLGHDRGFVLSLTAVADYKLTGNSAAKDAAIEGARQLAQRFIPEAGIIRAFDKWPWETDAAAIEQKRGRAIIDTMMNLPLLMWTSAETGEAEYAEIARIHADTVLKTMVRPDYSTYHHFQFSTVDFKPERGMTAQGYADESCWARGQSWAVYGFALMYRYTREERYLAAAKSLGEYFMSRLCENGLPAWDFDARGEDYRPYDSSAAAVAACGLLEIYGQCKEQKYRDMAQRLMDALFEFCLEPEQGQALINHCCVGPVFVEDSGERKINHSTDTPTPYGDYFFYEAVLRLGGECTQLFW